MELFSNIKKFLSSKGKTSFPREDFDTSVEHIFVSEGGYVDHPRDPGGATNMGITFNVLQDWRGTPIKKDDVRSLTKVEAKAIYKEKYWDVVRASEMPLGVGLVVFDAAVNSGPRRSVKWLQAALGVKIDGVLGPVTMEAVNKADPTRLVNKLCDVRLAFLKSLSTWPVFGKGWGNRVFRLRSDALEKIEKYRKNNS